MSYRETIEGLVVEARDLELEFLSTPGDLLVQKLMSQMAKVPQFVKLFGVYDDSDEVSWANYPRDDWQVRNLPAINIYESQVEAKQAENGYMTGNITIHTMWPPSLRRSELARVPAAFKGILENFFHSRYAGDMLDEHVSIRRDEKVPGLNELGKTLNWTPNVESLVADGMVPVTIVDVSYRIDLRAWYRELEFENRTEAEPFKVTLDDLTQVIGEIDGVINNNADDVQVRVPVTLKDEDLT